MKKITLIVILFFVLGVRVEAKEISEKQDANYQSEEFCESKILTSVLEKCDEGYWDYIYRNDLIVQYGPAGLGACFFLDDATKFTYDIAIVSDQNSGTEAYVRFYKENLKFNTYENLLEEITQDSTSIAGMKNWVLMQFSGFAMSYYEEIDKILSENLNQNYYKYALIKTDDCETEIVRTTETEEDTFVVRLINCSYYINKGDTLSEIAEDLCVDIEYLMYLNPEIVNPDLIYADTLLKII